MLVFKFFTLLLKLNAAGILPDADKGLQSNIILLNVFNTFSTDQRTSDSYP